MQTVYANRNVGATKLLRLDQTSTGEAPPLGRIGSRSWKWQAAGTESLAQTLLTQRFFVWGEILVAHIAPQHHAVVSRDKPREFVVCDRPQGLNIVGGVGGQVRIVKVEIDHRDHFPRRQAAVDQWARPRAQDARVQQLQITPVTRIVGVVVTANVGVHVVAF